MALVVYGAVRDTAECSVLLRIAQSVMEVECKVPDIEELKKIDGYLFQYEPEITRRYSSVFVVSKVC